MQLSNKGIPCAMIFAEPTQKKMMNTRRDRERIEHLLDGENGVWMVAIKFVFVASLISRFTGFDLNFTVAARKFVHC
jgi:hypothetical protein